MCLHWSIIVLPATCLGKYASSKIVTVSQNERQRSINDCCDGILYNKTGIERRSTTMDLSQACISKNAIVDIASALYNCAPTVRLGSERYTAINCSMMILYGGLRSQSLQSVLVFHITNMHAMSDWSYYFPCRCRFNIKEPAICFTVSLFSAVSRVGLRSFSLSTAMSDTQSLNTALLEVMISSKNERVFIRDLSNLT